MAIFYEENAVFTGNPGSLRRLNPNKKWAEHFSNSLILTAIQQKPKDLREKIQATKELGICERKMQYWTRHPEFSQEQATRDAAAMRALWDTPVSGRASLGPA